MYKISHSGKVNAGTFFVVIRNSKFDFTSHELFFFSFISKNVIILVKLKWNRAILCRMYLSIVDKKKTLFHVSIVCSKGSWQSSLLRIYLRNFKKRHTGIVNTELFIPIYMKYQESFAHLEKCNCELYCSSRHLSVLSVTNWFSWVKFSQFKRHHLMQNNENT